MGALVWAAERRGDRLSLRTYPGTFSSISSSLSCSLRFLAAPTSNILPFVPLGTLILVRSFPWVFDLEVMVLITVYRAQCWDGRGRDESGHLPLTFEELEIKKCTGNRKSMWTSCEWWSGGGHWVTAPWEERWPGTPDWSGVRVWSLCPDRPEEGDLRATLPGHVAYAL